MQMAFPKYTGAIDFPLKTMAPVQRYRKQAGRGSLTSYLDKKTAGQVKEIGQYAQSQSGILEKSLWFLNRAVYRSIARPVRSRCKRPHRKLHVLFFRPPGIPLPLACVNGPLSELICQDHHRYTVKTNFTSCTSAMAHICPRIMNTWGTSSTSGTKLQLLVVTLQCFKHMGHRT